MDERHYWLPTLSRRVSRRSMMRGVAVAGAGLAGAALIGCGDAADGEAVPAPGRAAPTTGGSDRAPPAAAIDPDVAPPGGTVREAKTTIATPLVISHRTNMGTMPENTLAGVDQAIVEGADGIEIDVRATRDGEIVLLHDASLERTTGDPRALADITSEELSTVRVSPLHAYAEPQPVPTLAQTLERVDGRAILVIELKESGVEAAVARIVRAAGAAERCWIWAFDPAVCVASRRELPEVPVALNVAQRSAERFGLDSFLEIAEREELAAVSLDHRIVDAGAVDRAHERGLAVYTWTVNEPADIERVREAGVDAICGDSAAGLRRVLDR